MDIIRGIPNRYLFFGCIFLCFLVFIAAGIAYDQNPFFGIGFYVLSVLLFFLSIHIGREAYRLDDKG
ncbi:MULTISPECIES: hypothetical protein [unclassified Methanoregula]|uniref:hypothetical protein n=1 Tax=unclassified Methanoregula TaxID=2649730 RepID=UPI0025EA1E70|nr:MULTISPECIES: hypothetical protein [unclassified Methanoregula]